ncbi:MAG: bifunctional riboflavin kinase/FAD synthetase [Bergeyella sp.]|nr:bifunctional riboflavin kinase/FAD synthetase [Bergeyella sp.]
MFDGVHLGHRYIVETLKSLAKSSGQKTAILTFWPHPRMVFESASTLRLLSSLEEKEEILRLLGVEKFFIQSFDESFRNLTGEEFVKKILVDRLKVRTLVVGYDHVFGKNKSGNFALLKKLSKLYDFALVQTDPVSVGGRNVSSTEIRKILQEGRIAEANAMLGYFYSITGEVVHGRKLGRTLGYPTANLKVDSHVLLPKNGAYIVEVEVEGHTYRGMMSIGVNPTFEDAEHSVEVYVLNFEKEIYGEKIKVRFREFLHEEIKFESAEKLKQKLDEDRKITAEFGF